jgi:hypothetical protein
MQVLFYGRGKGVEVEKWKVDGTLSFLNCYLSGKPAGQWWGY